MSDTTTGATVSGTAVEGATEAAAGLVEGYENLRVSLAGGVLTIELHRPGRLNALSADLLEELGRAVALAYHDDARVLVLRGAGRSFCAGYDVTAITAEGTFRDRWLANSRLAAVVRAIEEAPVVRVAQLHGHVVGAGLILATLCELRYAAPDTRFSVPELDLGIPFSYGGISRLARYVGLTRAADMVLTCTPLAADQALAAGLVTEVVEATELGARVGAVAERLAARPPVLVAQTLVGLHEAARDLLPADTVDLPQMFLAQDDPEARAVNERYLERFRR
ncbi:enoyl-CoA hydratase/isomerase family protein [Georgenia daeguensis]|uniref:Enoyl-CoA hydratase/isomerase family protein n=1 Tax=Georgenia daeguensis TaxID=908355 RepID=A0ABP8EUH5_9MICO